MAMSSGNGTAVEIQLGEYYDIGHGRLRIWEDRIKSGKITTAGGLDLVFGLVADGVGGTGAGEAASQAVVDAVSAYLQTSKQTDLLALVEDALEQAHTTVRAMAAENPALRSMSTTATLAVVNAGMLYLAHIGDSRAYLVRGRQIIQLTLDHTWGNEMVRQGRFKPDEVAKHPKREELARYIGQPQHVPLEIDAGYRWLAPDSLEPHPAASELKNSALALQPGDVIVLCSDGLIKERHNGSGHYVESSEIVDEILRPRQDANVLARMLVSRALGRQTDDNVSVVVLDVPGGEKPAAVPPLRSALAGALRRESPAGSALPELLAGVNRKTLLLALIAVALLALAGIVAGMLMRPSGEATLASAIQTQTPPTLTQAAPAASGAAARVVALNGVIEYSLPGGAKTLLNQGEQLPLAQGLHISSALGGVLQLEFRPNDLLVLDGDSAVRVLEVASAGSGSTANIIEIEQGRALVKGPFWVFNAAQREFKAEGRDTLMGVHFEPASGNFTLDCLAGQCRLGDTYLEAGYRLGYVGGVPQTGSFPADYQAWLALAPGLVPAPTETPTPTLTPTPTETATPTLTVELKILVTPTETPKDKDKKLPSANTPEPPDTRVTPTNTPNPGEG